MKKILCCISMIVISTIIAIIIISISYGLVDIRSDAIKNNSIYYDDESFLFVNVITGSGSRGTSYNFGAITKDDYYSWVNGENGTVFVYRLTSENRGWRISNSAITSISIYDKDKILPLNFK